MQQFSFSTLWSGYSSDSEAKKARSAKAKELRKQGFEVHSHTLRNQLKKYAGVDQEDGHTCNVYMLNVYGENDGC